MSYSYISVSIAKASEVGGCNGCSARPVYVYDIDLHYLPFRLCDKCWNDLYGKLANARLYFDVAASKLADRPSMNEAMTNGKGEPLVVCGQEAIYCIKCKQFIDMCKCPERMGLTTVHADAMGEGRFLGRIGVSKKGVGAMSAGTCFRFLGGYNRGGGVMEPGSVRWEHLKKFSTAYLLKKLRGCCGHDLEGTTIIQSHEYTYPELRAYMATRPHVANRKESKAAAIARKKSGTPRKKKK